MSGNTYNLTIKQGYKYTLAVTPKDSSGAVRDLTGYAARFQIRSVNRVDEFYEATGDQADQVGKAIQFVNSGSGNPDQLILTIPSATSAEFDFSSGLHEFELIDPDSEAELLVEGSVTLSPRLIQ